MPTVLGLDHVQLAMPAGGEDTARSFYRDLLGLTEVSKPPVLAARGGCWFALPGSTSPVGEVHLGAEESFVPAHKAHPGLLVDDLDEMVAVLAAHDVAFAEDRNIEGLRRGHIADPFGNRIELVQA
jgi:catechol 2,3-dioxygenase-like lactoylglutathione lyase family enzyme